MAEAAGTINVEVIPTLDYSKVIAGMDVLSQAFLDLYLQTRKSMAQIEEFHREGR